MRGLKPTLRTASSADPLTELDGVFAEFGERFIEGGKVATEAAIGKQAAKHGDDDHQPGSDAEPAIADLLVPAPWPRPPVRLMATATQVAQAMARSRQIGRRAAANRPVPGGPAQCGHSPFRLARRECRTPPRELRSGWNRLA